MKSIFEECGGTYTQGADGMLYPNLIMEPKEHRSIGRWGRMHRAYLEAEHPGLYERLILNGANIFPEGMAEPGYSQILAAYERNKAALPEHPEKQDRFDLLALMVEEPKIDPKELAALKMPVLVIAGTQDMIREEHTRLIAESIPGAELVFLEGDHFIAHERPEAFNARIEKFLKNREAVK